MPASITPNAKNQFIDIDGNPLVGGFVYMYEINTLIFKDTWQDADQNVLNTNPITLDSRGQAVIYGVGSYRQIVTDADGNQIWDRNIENFQESVFGPQVTIPSATTTDLGAATSNNILITGVTTINSFGTNASAANPVYLIQFSGILQLTYNATSMVLPGGANITTAAGDSAMVEVTNAASGYWRMIAYFSSAAGGSLGTAAGYNIGTSGATVPLNNGNNIAGGINRFQKQTYGDESALTITAGTTTPNFALANNFTVSSGSNFTIASPTNVQAGQSGIIRVTQTAGGVSVTWGAAFKAAGGIASVNLSGLNGAIDYFPYYAHSASEIVLTPLLNIS